jgi:hypothetical protein
METDKDGWGRRFLFWQAELVRLKYLTLEAIESKQWERACQLMCDYICLPRPHEEEVFDEWIAENTSPDPEILI